jgi:hypothetical protein
MKTIRFKIDEELFKKVDAIRGNTSNQVSNIVNEFEKFRDEMAYKDALIKSMKDEKIIDMQNQLNFLQ